jgi:hypothetical protein
MRIDLSAAAKKQFPELHNELGMTQLAMSSRLLEWFADQAPEIQRKIMMKESNADAARDVLMRMANKR